jgi:signal transduction histidine kinase/DNA-binding response OmpR family regulator
MRLLHLEDDPTDALLIERAIKRADIAADITQVKSAADFCNQLESNTFDVVIIDHGIPGFNAQAAVKYSRQHQSIPVIVCSGAVQLEDVNARLQEGATDYVLKDQLWQLVSSLRHIDHDNKQQQHLARIEQYNAALHRLVDIAQQLSLARNLAAIMEIVRHTARELTHADGATFVLREAEHCYYADEDAIAPLWKGQRLPLQACLSGWVMTHEKSVAIEDIYADPRVPNDAYRPTFVKSMAIAPIRRSKPLGAIEVYWATPHATTAEEMKLLESLANTTATAIENVQLYSQLEQRVQQRTQEFQQVNRELEAYSYAVSHDLRTPLRAINGQLQILLEDFATQLNDDAKHCLTDALDSTRHMAALINDLLRLSRINQAVLQREPVDLSEMIGQVIERLRSQYPDRRLQVRIAPQVNVTADRGLLSAVVENLVSNAWKYTGTRPFTTIEFGVAGQATPTTYFLRDNGLGFDMTFAEKLFQPFQRMHNSTEFPGSGIGLATVRRIVERHGGHIWADSAPEQGATFYFTLSSSLDHP